MSQIPVKITNYALQQLRHSRNAVHDKMRQRAYYLYLQKGCKEGQELENWLSAEREVLCFPPSELEETKDEYRIKVGVPGFGDYTLQLDVLPHSINAKSALAHIYQNTRYAALLGFTENEQHRSVCLPPRGSPCALSNSAHTGLLPASR